MCVLKSYGCPPSTLRCPPPLEVPAASLKHSSSALPLPCSRLHLVFAVPRDSCWSGRHLPGRAHRLLQGLQVRGRGGARGEGGGGLPHLDEKGDACLGWPDPVAVLLSSRIAQQTPGGAVAPAQRCLVFQRAIPPWHITSGSVQHSLEWVHPTWACLHTHSWQRLTPQTVSCTRDHPPNHALHAAAAVSIPPPAARVSRTSA
jgi:hypothetical protein